MSEMWAACSEYEERSNQLDVENQEVIKHYRQLLYTQYAEHQATIEMYEQELVNTISFYRDKMRAADDVDPSSSAAARPFSASS
ncbi:hypothetical protein AAC387_Pa12g2051 [Persea americana]